MYLSPILLQSPSGRSISAERQSAGASPNILSPLSMAEFTEFREPQRESSFVRPIDPNARDALRRSRASHQSHHSQLSQASTRSWVYTTQQNPPSAPPPEPIPIPSPSRTARGLAELDENAQVPLDLDEEEYMNIDPNEPDLEESAGYAGIGRGGIRGRGIGMGFGGASGSGMGMGNGNGNGNVQGNEMLGTSGSPSRADGGRGFVGGFFSGLRKLPKVVLRGYGNGGSSEKKKPVRRGTIDTEQTAGTETSATGATGTSLPRYATEPPTPTVTMRPSNVRYVVATEMPMPMTVEVEEPEPEPEIRPRRQSATSHLSNHPPIRQRHPSLRITPPSVHTADDEPPRQRQDEPEHVLDHHERDPEGPQYDQDVHDGETTAVHHGPNRRPSAEVDTPNTDDVVLVDLLPTDDYRKMSPPSSDGTQSESSIMPQINRVHKFFHDINHMPWVASERVTNDYLPGNSRGRGRKPGGQSGRPAAPEKPSASWYNLSDHHSSFDLESGGTPSTASTPASPISPRSRTRPARRHRASNDAIAASPTLGYQDPYTSPPYRNSPHYSSPDRRHAHAHSHSHSHDSPRSPPRHHRHHSRNHSQSHSHGHSHSQPHPHPHVQSPVYPHGYAPYISPPPPPIFSQPPPPQPMYIMQTRTGSGGGSANGQHLGTPDMRQQQQQQQQMVPVYMVPAPGYVLSDGGGGGGQGQYAYAYPSMARSPPVQTT